MTDQPRYYRNTPSGTIREYAACCPVEPACTPIVVLDPSDNADVQRLTDALVKVGYAVAENSSARRILDALLPPEPVTEPGGGAWAVVKDRDGDVWVRHEDGRWGFGAHEGSCDWSSLALRYGPLIVMREGIES